MTNTFDITVVYIIIKILLLQLLEFKGGLIMEYTINVLIVEDDMDINNLLAEILLEDKYNITQSYSGTEAKLLLEREQFDLVLLDLMLPGLSGEEIVTLIRKEHTMPIIIISARLDTTTKVELLQLGADDFIEKPFDIKEVLARANAHTRRYKEFSKQGDSENILNHKNISLYEDEMKVLLKGSEMKLTKKEYDILHLLLLYPKKVFTKANLFEKIWEDEVYIDDNTLNVHVSNLRNKLSLLDTEEYIETVWGIGFKLHS